MFPLHDTIQSRHAALIAWTLIAVNVLVYLFESSLPEARLAGFFDTWGLIPCHIVAEPGPASFAALFSSMFLHSGWAHLLGNMWFLHVFGDNVEDRMGHGRFLLFYLCCGVAAALTQVATNQASSVLMVGASGAISGVLGAHWLFFPRATVIAAVPVFYLIRFMEVPAVIFLGFWFVLQFLSGFASLLGPQGAEVGGVAFFAHIGGFVAGIVLARLFQRPDVERREMYPDEFHPW